MSIEKPGLILSTDTLELVALHQRIRARFGGRVVADTRAATLLREAGHLPVLYLPRGDVAPDALAPSATSTRCPRKGDARYWHLRAGERIVEDAVWAYPEPLAGVEPLAAYVAFRFEALDAWFEEDEPLEPHPRDPYHRIDALRSGRHVHVELAGETLADTRRPVMLLETDLPPRYYLPLTDTALERLRPSRTRTACPYKGHARYHHVEAGGQLHRDVAWSYPFPRSAASRLADLVSFDPARVDVLTVDGEPVTA